MDQQCQVRDRLNVQCQHTASARTFIAPNGHATIGITAKMYEGVGFGSFVVLMCKLHAEALDKLRLDYVNSVIKMVEEAKKCES